AKDIMNVIDRLGNVGELWVRFMADEHALEQMLKIGGAGDDAMEAIRDALDSLIIPEVMGGEEEEAEEEAVPEVVEVEAEVEEAEAEALEVEAEEEPEPVE